MQSNIQTDRTYWFFFESHIHVEKKGKDFLLYNTLDKEFHYYQLNNKTENIIERLLADDMNVIELDVETINNRECNGFVSSLQEKFLAEMIDTSLSIKKPRQFMPNIKIMRDIGLMKKYVPENIGEGILSYLNEITIRISNNCTYNCDYCHDAYKQVPCCFKKSKAKTEMSMENVAKICDEIKGSSCSTVNILGGNIFDNPGFKDIHSFLASQPYIKIYYIHYKHLTGAIERTNLFSNNYEYLNIFISPDINAADVKSVHNKLKYDDLNFKFKFIIGNESDYLKAEEIITKNKIESFKILPVYSHKNRDFFIENIFTEKEEILNRKLEQKDVYLNKILNQIFLGKLFIDLNGSTFSSINSEELGNVFDIGIKKIVKKEIMSGRNWMKIREKIEPCKNCLYACFCPPISNYEKIIGKNNLCKVFEN